MEFFTTHKIISLIAWIGFVVIYYRSYNRHKKEIWTGIIGPDKKIQAIEIAVWMWVKFFPINFFLTTLLVIIDLPMNDYMESLMITVWTATNTLFAVAIAAKAWGKNGNGTTEDSKKD